MNELITLFNKTFGLNSVEAPFGSCTEIFLLNKSIETVEKSELNTTDKENLIKLFRENMYHNKSRFSNGHSAGKWYINIIKDYFNNQ